METLVFAGSSWDLALCQSALEIIPRGYWVRKEKCLRIPLTAVRHVRLKRGVLGSDPALVFRIEGLHTLSPMKFRKENMESAEEFTRALIIGSDLARKSRRA